VELLYLGYGEAEGSLHQIEDFASLLLRLSFHRWVFQLGKLGGVHRLQRPAYRGSGCVLAECRRKQGRMAYAFRHILSRGWRSVTATAPTMASPSFSAVAIPTTRNRRAGVDHSEISLGYPRNKNKTVPKVRNHPKIGTENGAAGARPGRSRNRRCRRVPQPGARLGSH
jgi:hypothetical protein